MRRSPLGGPWPCGRGLAVALLLALAANGCAFDYFFLRQEPVANSSLADPREPVMRAELARGRGYYLGEVPAKSADGRSPAVTYGLIDVGHRLPLVTLSRGRLHDRDPEAPYDDQTWALQFATPVVFHLIWDPFSPVRSAPIVDTDYEFGGWMSARRGLSVADSTRPRWEVRSGVYLGHISTHVGDEYVTHAQADPRFPFPRINVSHEPWRANLGLRRTSPRRKEGQEFYDFQQVYVQFEGASFDKRKGNSIYYQLEPSELDGLRPDQIAATSYGVDGFVAVDWRHYLGRMRTYTDHHDLARPASLRFAVAVGRMRAFAYDPVRLGSHQRDVATFDLVASWTPDESMIHSLSAEPYIRFYRGVNPYGQLRNDAHFWLTAFGIRWSY